MSSAVLRPQFASFCSIASGVCHNDDNSCEMAPASSVPSQISGFIVLPIALPPLPSYPKEATHHLYLSPHQPKNPEANTDRSLFLVNVPFNSTELHIKQLLSTQLGLPAGRIEEVRFNGKRGGERHKDDSSTRGQPLQITGKKRKRRIKGSKQNQIEGAELPSTWDRELVTGDLTAVVLFIDKSSANAVLKAAKNAKKDGMKPVWGEGLEDKVPPLGSASMLCICTVPLSLTLMQLKDIFATRSLCIQTKPLYSTQSTNI